jgi:hypothetical protein
MIKSVRQVLALFVFVVAASASSAGQQRNACAEEQPYDFTTSLSGGYRIVFKTDNELKYLSLWKGKRKIAELSSVSCGLLHKNLGYVAADFPKHFAFVNSFGSGNPHFVSLIRKADGSDILSKEKNVCWVDADEKNSLMIYSTACVPKATSRMVLINMKTLRKRAVRFPRIVLTGPEALNRISIVSASRNVVTLEFENWERTRSTRLRYRF